MKSTIISINKPYDLLLIYLIFQDLYGEASHQLYIDLHNIQTDSSETHPDR